MVNIITGESFIFEYIADYELNPTTFDELERFVSVYCPNEVILIHCFDEISLQNVLQYTSLDNKMIHTIDESSHQNDPPEQHPIFIHQIVTIHSDPRSEPTVPLPCQILNRGRIIVRRGVAVCCIRINYMGQRDRMDK